MKETSSPPRKDNTICSIEWLPNWWFALALACFYGAEEESRRRQYRKSASAKHSRTISGDEEEDEEKEEEYDFLGEQKTHSFTATTSKHRAKQREEKESEVSTLSLFFTKEIANFYLLQAILAWPQIYRAILQEILSSSLGASFSKRIRSIASHSFFSRYSSTAE